jgi:hypothetical protein
MEGSTSLFLASSVRSDDVQENKSQSQILGFRAIDRSAAASSVELSAINSVLEGYYAATPNPSLSSSDELFEISQGESDDDELHEVIVDIGRPTPVKGGLLNEPCQESKITFTDKYETKYDSVEMVKPQPRRPPIPRQGVKAPDMSGITPVQTSGPSAPSVLISTEPSVPVAEEYESSNNTIDCYYVFADIKSEMEVEGIPKIKWSITNRQKRVLTQKQRQFFHYLSSIYGELDVTATVGGEEEEWPSVPCIFNDKIKMNNGCYITFNAKVVGPKVPVPNKNVKSDGESYNVEDYRRLREVLIALLFLLVSVILHVVIGDEQSVKSFFILFAAASKMIYLVFKSLGTVALLYALRRIIIWYRSRKKTTLTLFSKERAEQQAALLISAYRTFEEGGSSLETKNNRYPYICRVASEVKVALATLDGLVPEDTESMRQAVHFKIKNIMKRDNTRVEHMARDIKTIAFLVYLPSETAIRAVQLSGTDEVEGVQQLLRDVLPMSRIRKVVNYLFPKKNRR